MSQESDVKATLDLPLADRARVVALLIVRYCGFHADPHFSPWFKGCRDALAKVRELSVQVCRQGLPAVPDVSRPVIEETKEFLDELIRKTDPDGLPFEIEVADHLAFASEVLDCLLEPEGDGFLTHAFEHADELAEARREMGEEDYPGGDWELVNFPALEAAARRADIKTVSVRGQAVLDVAPLLARSEAFAMPYADVIARCYTDEEAGWQA